MPRLDAQIDLWVERIHSAPREPISYAEIPPSVRTSPADEEAWSWNWEIRRAPVSWISPLQNRLERPFPRAYFSLVSRYIFPAFEWNELQFFANTPEANALWEVRTEIFRVYEIGPMLKANFLPFARPASGDFDPICFDFSQSGAPTIVRIEHEALICHQKIGVSQVLARSFEALLAP